MLLCDLLKRYIRDEAHLIVINWQAKVLYSFNRDGEDFPPDLMMRRVSDILVEELDGCLAIRVY